MPPASASTRPFASTSARAINALTTTAGALSLSSSAGPIPASVTFNSDNSVVTIVPLVPLPASTAITVSIDGFEDVAGNRMAAHVSQFTTGAGADTVRPTVIASNVTAYGVNNVPINSIFQITFDEPMDAATVLSQGAAFLYDYGIGNYVTGSASMSPDGLTLTFVPAAPLAVNRQHGLFMSSGFDLSGNQQVGFSLVFTTVFAGDTTPPVVLGVNPPDGLTNVPRNARVEVRFNESISALEHRQRSAADQRRDVGGGDANAVRHEPPVDAQAERSACDEPRLHHFGGRRARHEQQPDGHVHEHVHDRLEDRSDRPDDHVDESPCTATPASVSAPSARVTFSEPIDPLSISADTFRMAHAAGGDYLDAIVVLAADRRSATLTPVTPLLPYTWTTTSR